MWRSFSSKMYWISRNLGYRCPATVFPRRAKRNSTAARIASYFVLFVSGKNTLETNGMISGFDYFVVRCPTRVWFTVFSTGFTCLTAPRSFFAGVSSVGFAQGGESCRVRVWGQLRSGWPRLQLRSVCRLFKAGRENPSNSEF